MDKIKWYGYLHINNTVHLKRYFGQNFVPDMMESPFVQAFHGPFEADDAQDAREVLNRIYKPQLNIHAIREILREEVVPLLEALEHDLKQENDLAYVFDLMSDVVARRIIDEVL